MKMKELLKNKRFLAIALPCLAVLITLGIVLGVILSKKDTDTPAAAVSIDPDIDISGLLITPVHADSAGVDVQSAFKITNPADLSQDVLAALLKVTPAQEFKLKKVSGREYLLNFEGGMSPNKIYRFDLAGVPRQKERSWAFQTKKTFRVLRTLPRDKGTSVPVNTGIELSFNYENITGVDSYFEISPKAEGSFEYHKKTVVFVPKELQYNTIYTVTVKKGLGLKDSSEKTPEDFTFQFQTEQKPVPGEASTPLEFADTFYNFTSAATPAMEVYTYDKMQDPTFKVEVFQYADEKPFINDLKKFDSLPSWAYLPGSRVVFDTSKLQKVLSVDTGLLTGDDGSDWGYPHYLVLPEPLPEGYYVVNATRDGITSQTHLQVSDTAVYASIMKNQTLVWVNNSRNGAPVEGAAVEFEGAGAVKTGKDGVALIQGQIPVPKLGSHYRFTVKPKGGNVFTGRMNVERSYNYQDFDTGFYYEYSDEVKNDYWTYLYLDRGLYLPDDTVNVWGLVKSRGKAEPVTKGKLMLIPQSYYYDNTDMDNSIASMDVDVAENGTFQGKLSFTSLSAGYYTVQLKSGDKVITTNSFEIRKYTKPAYKITVTPDRDWIFGWESSKFGIQANFFEGTPVPKMKINYNYYYEAPVEGNLVTDDNGQAQLSVTPSGNSASWHPKSLYLSVNSSQAEEQEVTGGGSITVFPRDTMIEFDAEKSNGSVKVDVRANRIDPGKVKDTYGFYDRDQYRGDAADIPLKATIIEKHWESRETGTQYDFINKKTYKTYEYYEVTHPVKELDFTTANGKFSFEFPREEDKAYHITITGTDSRKNTISEDRNCYFDYYEPGNEKKIGYRLEKKDAKNSYRTGDKITVSTVANEDNASTGPGTRSLFLTLQNGYQKYSIVSGNDYTFDFSKDCIPNVYIMAACFDGANIYNAGLKNFSFDSEERKLTLDVKTDKTEYKPGETVEVDVSVKDAENKPCKAAVNISVVDEAFFAIVDQWVDPLSSLYNYSLPTGVQNYYVSYTPLDPNARNSTAEMGEGGDTETIRSKFKDTACFESVVTGSNGKGKLSFKLPDNLTSWRITYQGVTEDMAAGSGKINISTKLPFFADVIFNKVFMAGDRPTLTVRSFGTELTTTGPVEYTVVLDDNKGNKQSFTSKASAQTYVGMDLGKLGVGNYTATVTAKYGKFSDSLQRTFSVADYLLEAARVNFDMLKADTRPKGGKGLTTLVFNNKQSSFLYNALTSLKYTWGERVDQALSRKVGSRLFQQYFKGEDPWGFFGEEEFDPGQYQLTDGGIALVSYDSSNPVLSAKICSVAKDSFDTGALANYFYNILANKDETAENIAASYWGLAALGEPVLLDVKNLLASGEMGLKEKLYLGAALSDLGDETAAQEIYNGIMSTNRKNVDPYIYITPTDTRDDAIELTALASVIAMKLHAPEEMGLYNYVKDNSTKEILTNLETMILATNMKPDLVTEGKFTYLLDGKSTTVSLKKDEQYTLTLTAEKLATLKFSDITGDIAVTSRFVGPVKDLMNGNTLSQLKRSYRGDKGGTSSFARSELVKVTLTPQLGENAPDGYYEITDILPAGFKYVEGKPYDDERWYPQEVSGEKIVFCYYYGKNNEYFAKKPPVITYYVRAVNPGEYTADNAVIRHYDSNASGFSEQDRIKISK